MFIAVPTPATSRRRKPEPDPPRVRIEHIALGPALVDSDGQHRRIGIEVIDVETNIVDEHGERRWADDVELSGISAYETDWLS